MTPGTGQVDPGSLRARSLTAAADPQEAASRLSTLADDAGSILGEHHPDTLLIQHNLAAFTRLAARIDNAIVHFVSIIPEFALHFGPEHRETARARCNLTSWRRIHEQSLSKEE
jgi:hypothetical protein